MILSFAFLIYFIFYSIFFEIIHTFFATLRGRSELTDPVLTCMHSIPDRLSTFCVIVFSAMGSACQSWVPPELQKLSILSEFIWFAKMSVDKLSLVMLWVTVVLAMTTWSVFTTCKMNPAAELNAFWSQIASPTTTEKITKGIYSVNFAIRAIYKYHQTMWW